MDTKAKDVTKGAKLCPAPAKREPQAGKSKPIRVKEHHNYVAYFLTLSCNLRCPYCINLHGNGLKSGKKASLTPEEWIQAANRLTLRDDLPLTLQGGEPTIYKGFYKIVNDVKEAIKMDLLTNMSFDADEFIRNVPLRRFTREAPYAPIRVSYHPGQNDIEELIKKTFKLQDAGFKIGIYGILHPKEELKQHILETKERCLKLGIDFRTKEFLGEWEGTLRGNYKYEGSVGGAGTKYCECRTTELIVGPDGHIYRCHGDLYNGRTPVAHISDADFNEEQMDKFRGCRHYGACNPCDVKIKTNRFQIFGHTSVEIKNVK